MDYETVEFGNIKTGMEDRMLLERIKDVYRKISSAVIRSGRNPFDVKLIAVTKTVPLERIKAAADLGLRVFGENRVQEAQEKIAACRSQCPDCAVEWHMIGHLQKNKAKTAVRLFEVIHSLDSIELAGLLNKHAEEAGKVQRVLIEVKLSPEETKYGVARENLMALVKSISGMKNLKLEGLMTIPPFFENPETARPYFRNLRYLRDEAEKKGFKLPELSMGMTNDYEVAILEGATMVRIGTGIFGERK
ncbi:MAG: YggS family pyridoxal phosphate-dependent enzyme [Thermodesulfovibrionales bacterium]